MKFPVLLVAVFLALTACASPHVEQYQNNTPKLDLTQYFVGTTDGWGMFQKRNGDVVKRFHVQIIGTEKNNQLILDEHFQYDDGTAQQRIWTLTQDKKGHWNGHADDVKGNAQGLVAGNALHWNYTLRLPVDQKVYDMQMDDWMYQIDNLTMINQTRMTKFGFEVGQVTIFFKKRA
ncbi:DUF3833 domain-containing protein [Aquirhabdus parva]|uniref:DUF3833 domain-containing protein n=1 Tax=Aquirhabdus parva TaxID=2283318 RepID=A0A345P4V6_9GAMM|nr:DUF3833 domain-containing protein [Aquirhabdus parva]AXI02315.1 DUF3833 domain-containing protein [Aquirhabdus parva]